MIATLTAGFRQFPFRTVVPPSAEPFYSEELGGRVCVPSEDTRVIFVDSENGLDTNDGRWPYQRGVGLGPVKSAFKGYDLLRDGYPDWLAFRSGRTWETGDVYSGGADLWEKSGRSADEPMLIVSFDFGGGRPVIYGAGEGPPVILSDGSNLPITSNFDPTSEDVLTSGIRQALGDQNFTPPTADSLGWTGLNPTTGSQVIYVSSTDGDNANNGLDPNTPKKTIAAGLALLRNGQPDWLLLKRGDTFPGETLGSWTRSGLDATHPMVVSAYGTSVFARPKIGMGTQNCLQINGTCQNIAFTHLDLEQSFVENGFARPINMEGGKVVNLLIEGCRVANGCNNITLSSPGNATRSQNVVIRRCAVVDAYRTSGSPGACGFYFQAIDGILVEECIVDSNGVQYPDHKNTSDFVYGHAFYVQGGDPASGSENKGCTNVIIRGNIVSRGDGIGMRSQATVRDNLVLRSPLGMTFGTNDNSPPQGAAGFTVDVYGNIFLGGDDLYLNGSWTTDAGHIRGTAMTLANIAAGSIAYNIIANNSESTSKRMDQTTVGANQPIGMYASVQLGGITKGITNCEIHHNVIYRWGGGIAPWSGESVAMGVKSGFSGATGLSFQNVSFHDNDIQFPGNVVNSRILGIWHHDDGAANSRAGVTGADNRYWCERGPGGAGMPAGSWNQTNGGTNYSMPAYLSTPVDGVAVPVDSTSTYGSAVAYSAPTRSMGDYYTSTGGFNGVTPDGTQETFLAAARLNRFGSWAGELMPTFVQAEKSAGALGTAYPVGGVGVGPLRYIRDGFDMTSLGMTVAEAHETGSPGDHTSSHLGGAAVTITGSGFLAGRSLALTPTPFVTFGGATAQNIVLVSDTVITCETPIHAVGTVDIVVDNGEGLVTLTNGWIFD